MLSPDALSGFLAQDWQAHPAVFRDAIDVSRYAPAVTNTELARLVSDDVVESRLVDAAFSVIHGPFESDGGDDDLLPEQSMLMVQCLEQLQPLISQMLTDAFAFIPRWQVDDVMATLGNDGASCGAHFDRYDVFLVQVRGSKTWHLDDGSHTTADLRPDAALRLLETFQPTRELLLEPGDVLYLPPGVGHHGVCVGESLTLSVGIRNPTPAEMVADLSEFVLETSGDESPMEGSLHQLQGGSQRLPPGIGQVLSGELQRLLDEETFTYWYGSYVTRLRNPDLIQPSGLSLADAERVVVPLASRIAWFQMASGELVFCINGDCHTLDAGSQPWIEQLASQRQAPVPASPSGTLSRMLDTLLADGDLVALET